MDPTNNSDVRAAMSLPHPLPSRLWKSYPLPEVVWLKRVNRWILISQFYHISYSSSFSQYFGSLHQSDLVGSFHFPSPLSLCSFSFHLPFLPQQLPSFIMLVSISSLFLFLRLYSLFCFILFTPAQSIPQPSLPPQANSHSITFTSRSTRCLIRTSSFILLSFI